MKKTILGGMIMAIAISSCTSHEDLYDEDFVNELEYSKVVPNVKLATSEAFKMTKEYTIPTQAGKVTVLLQGKDTLAITDHALDINIPKNASIVNSKTALSRADGGEETKEPPTPEEQTNAIREIYVDAEELTDYTTGSSKVSEEYVMMFEDAPVDCDYDYNDVVLLVKYDIDDNKKINIAVKPLAFSASNTIEFGFDYGVDGDEQVGIVLSDNVKRDFFGNNCCNTTKTYSPLITCKDYTLKNPFRPAILKFGSEVSLEAMKFDRKSYEEENTEEENAKLNKVELNNEGFYQFATIEGEFTPDKINFFIRPVITVTYYKTDNYEIGGNKLTGKIKYTSDFKYKLYAGDYNKQAKDKVPFGISIPVSSLKTNNVDYIYWPYETQPIWAGYPNFSDWLSENNDGSWIKNPQVEGTFNDTWNASLLIKGEATSNLKLPNVNKYASELKAIEAKMIQEKLAKESEEVKETEME